MAGMLSAGWVQIVLIHPRMGPLSMRMLDTPGVHSQNCCDPPNYMNVNAVESLCRALKSEK